MTLPLARARLAECVCVCARLHALSVWGNYKTLAQVLHNTLLLVLLLFFFRV